MTAADLSHAGADNLLRTYFALGAASPGSVVSRQEGFDACLGNFDHPICNFAGRLSLDPWAANRLVELAIERRYFSVYSVPGDTPLSREVRDELLTRAGFQRTYSLQQMYWEPRRAEDGISLRLAAGMAERRSIAIFMANQFFGRHSANFKRRVAEATSGAADLNLYGVYQRFDLIAAAMLVEDENVLGLFNLCVRPSMRNRGWGAKVVSETQRLAYEKGKFVSLQCDETLTSWYEGQGFETCEWVDVYGLSDKRRLAIIK